MLTWHLEPHPDHAAMTARGYLPGGSYAARSDYVAVCTILRRPDGTADAVGALSMAPLDRADREALRSALAAAGIPRLHSERGGRWVTWDTTSGQRVAVES